MANKQLNKTLKVGDVVYDINAVNADTAEALRRVFLTLNKHYAKDTSQTIDGITTIQRETITGTAHLKGDTSQTLDYVDANTGGHFEKPISVTAHDTNYDIEDRDILNYGELKTYFTEDLYKNLQNLSVGHIWDGTTLTLNGSTITGSTKIEGINVVYGTGDHADATKFAEYNRKAAQNDSSPYLSSFFYITTNKKISGELENSDCPYYAESIYFGTQDSSDIIRLRTDFAKQADNAIQADKLTSPVSITTDLTKNTADSSFDGSTNYTGSITGVLGMGHGGTGNRTGLASGLRHNINFSVTLDNEDAGGGENVVTNLFNASSSTRLSLDIPVHGVLPEQYGGTGDSEGHHPSAANVKGGPKIYAAENIIVKYKNYDPRAVPIIISTTQPTTQSDGITGLPQGTIWIQI